MATRTLTLTDQEVTLTRAALMVYARVKGAERMLEAHKRDANASEVMARYDKVLDIGKSVMNKLS